MPQPEGPMNAVISFALNVHIDGFQRMEIAIVQIQSSNAKFTAHMRFPDLFLVRFLKGSL